MKSRNMPPKAAINGSARRGQVSSCPSTISRLISRPTKRTPLCNLQPGGIGHGEAERGLAIKTRPPDTSDLDEALERFLVRRDEDMSRPPVICAAL